MPHKATKAKLLQISEGHLIDEVKAIFQKPASNVLGIGDDAAAVSLKTAKKTLISSDSLFEGVHFLRNQISATDLAYKSLAVNLSDIYAMGGKPKYFLLNLGLPKNLSHSWFVEFIKSLARLAKQHAVVLIGGDLCASPQSISISITIFGEGSTKNLKLRSGVNAGDLLCVHSPLGDSAAGLKILLENPRLRKSWSKLVRAHTRPPLFRAEALYLAKQNAVTAMMDLSDGLTTDAPRLAAASKVGFDIELSQIPISKHLKLFCSKFGSDSHVFAARGGEDYSLLFCVRASKFMRLQKAFKKIFKKELSIVGIATRSKKIQFLKNGSLVKVPKAFSHFA